MLKFLQLERAEVQVLLLGASLGVLWLRLHASNAGAMGLIPIWGTKLPEAT